MNYFRNPLNHVIQFFPTSKENQKPSMRNQLQKPMNYLDNFPQSKFLIRKISRTYHPVGLFRHIRLPLASRLEPVMEYSKGFPYLFPWTGNEIPEDRFEFD